MFEWDTWVCGESGLTVKDLTHHPSSWAPGVLLIVCFVCVVFWCGVLGLGFLSSFTTNLHVQ